MPWRYWLQERLKTTYSLRCRYCLCVHVFRFYHFIYTLLVSDNISAWTEGHGRDANSLHCRGDTLLSYRGLTWNFAPEFKACVHWRDGFVVVQLLLRSKTHYYCRGSIIADSKEDAGALMVISAGQVHVKVFLNNGCIHLLNFKICYRNVPNNF